jgi:predicted nucleic acid-binding protein
VIVLDASAVVEWLMGSARGDAVVAELRRDPDGLFYAPDLLDVEVVQAFRRLARIGVVSASRAGAAVALLEELPIERRPALALLPRVWALRDNLTAYDAAFIALAEALGCPLVTCDRRCGGPAGAGVEVRMVG